MQARRLRVGDTLPLSLLTRTDTSRSHFRLKSHRRPWRRPESEDQIKSPLEVSSRQSPISHLDRAVGNEEERDVQGPATEIVYQNMVDVGLMWIRLVPMLRRPRYIDRHLSMKIIGYSCRCRFLEGSNHLKSMSNSERVIAVGFASKRASKIDYRCGSPSGPPL